MNLPATLGTKPIKKVSVAPVFGEFYKSPFLDFYNFSELYLLVGWALIAFTLVALKSFTSLALTNSKPTT